MPPESQTLTGKLQDSLMLTAVEVLCGNRVVGTSALSQCENVRSQITVQTLWLFLYCPECASRALWVMAHLGIT